MTDEITQDSDGREIERSLRTGRRPVLKGITALGFASTAASTVAAEAAESWSLTGPDGRLEAIVTQEEPDGPLSLTIRGGETTLLEPSPLGITTADETFTTGLSFDSRTDGQDTGAYDMPHGKRSTRRYRANETTLTFTTADGSPLALDLRVSGEGVSYRYRLPGDGSVDVIEERSGFRLPDGAEAYVHPYTNNYEDIWREAAVSEMSGEYGFPTLFDVGDDEWVLLTEADVDGRYCASRLAVDESDALFDLTFPPDETVTTERPMATPWRVAIVGDLSTVVESDLVLDVSPESNVDDTSWIEPGRAAWSWWSDPDSPSDFERQKEFVDYAAGLDWEYVLVDDQWDDDWVPDLVDYANERGVDVILWTPWSGVNTEDQRNEKLPRWKSWGVVGIKVDFMDSDSQERMQFYDDILAATAEHGLMINFHGSTVPKGRRRRWPHLMTSEAVYGAEQYWGSIPPSHNAILPFTRNVVGPMDYTPVTFSTGNRRTTAAHELALSVVYQSSHQHFADNVDVYDERPLAERFLSAVDASWDETKLVDGRPGSEATIARRSGNEWFVGSITAGDARTVEMPLSFISNNRPYVAEIVGADETGETLVREWVDVRRGDTITHDVQEDGGVAVHLAPAQNVDPVVDTDGTTIEAGASGEVSVTLTNPSRSSVTDVEFDVTLPEEWEATSRTGTRFDRVGSKESVTATWEVSLPEDALPGEHELEVDVSYTSNGGPAEKRSAVLVEVPLNPLPEGWETFASTDAEFGSIAQRGTIVIDANGGEFYIDNDQYGALYRPGDQAGEEYEAIVKVASQENTDEWAKAGLMLRNDITAAGESTGYAIVAVTPGNGFALQWDDTGGGNGYLSANINGGSSSYPCWLKLEKDGSAVTGYYSTDAQTWNEIGSAEVPGVANPQDIGLFAVSQNENRLSRAEFDEFRAGESLPTTTLTTGERLVEAGESREFTATFTNPTADAVSDVDLSLDGPSSWETVATSRTSYDEVAAGESVSAAWDVTVPSDADSADYELTATTTYAGVDGSSQSAFAGYALTVPPAPPTGDTYLSAHEWIEATIGWGSIGLDESNGGNALSIGGQTYEKGLGTHAESEIIYYLGGNASRFVADVGIDDEVDNADEASVRFRVHGDGEALEETDVVSGNDGPVSLDVDVSGVDVLTLEVTDGGDNINYDHADWAIARVLE